MIRVIRIIRVIRVIKMITRVIMVIRVIRLLPVPASFCPAEGGGTSDNATSKLIRFG